MVNPDDWNLARDLFEHADSDNEFSGFDNLHRFSIETEDIETGIAACSEYGSVFSMAKEVQIVHINDIDMSTSKMQSHSSPIEHLYILEGEMGPEAVRVFIQLQNPPRIQLHLWKDRYLRRAFQAIRGCSDASWVSSEYT